MTEYQRQRHVPRIPLPDRPAARTRGRETVRLLEVSLQGARVVWSQVVGTAASPEGERLLRYQSGLWFSQVAGEQLTTLAQALEKAASGSP